MNFKDGAIRLCRYSFWRDAFKEINAADFSETALQIAFSPNPLLVARHFFENALRRQLALFERHTATLRSYEPDERVLFVERTRFYDQGSGSPYPTSC